MKAKARVEFENGVVVEWDELRVSVSRRKSGKYEDQPAVNTAGMVISEDDFALVDMPKSVIDNLKANQQPGESLRDTARRLDDERG